MRLLVAGSFVCVITIGAVAEQLKGASLDDLRFLVGEWQGDGSGKPGQAAAGGFSFSFELQGKVLVRRNFAEYAATAERPAFRHDDLMIVYEDSNGKGLQASYFDSEGHAIQYSVALSPDKRTLTFISDPSQSAPRYRFVFYRQARDDLLSFEFDIAPPGKADAFSKYIDGRAFRK